MRLLKAAPSSAISYDRLPTNTTTNSHPVHRWFNFIAGFSPEFVQATIELGNGPHRIVECGCLIRFSGCGTAPLAARLLGLSAVAYDPHPFFAKISEAKANSPIYWDDLTNIRTALLRGMSRSQHDCFDLSTSAAKFLTQMFLHDTLLRLCSARRELIENGLQAHPLAVLILSRVLDYCCFSATDGIYKAPATSQTRTTAARCP